VDSWRRHYRHFFVDAEALDAVALFAVGANVVDVSAVGYAFAVHFDDAVVVDVVAAVVVVVVVVVIIVSYRAVILVVNKSQS